MDNSAAKDRPQKKLCRLFCGGKCPVCDDEYEMLGISQEEAKQINDECCKNSYTPSNEELEEWIRRCEQHG